MSDNLVMIAAGDAKDAVNAAVAVKPDASLEDRLLAAFEATRHHWLVTDDNTQFRAGIGGVLLTANPEEKARIEAELHRLKVLSAAMSGVDLTDFGAEDAPAPIGMLALWRAAKAQP